MTIWTWCSTALIFVVVLVIASSLQAEVKLHRLFTDNGILQRGGKVPIWGTSDKSDPVTVKFGEQTVTATPQDSKWKAELALVEANPTPRDLVVTQGDQTLTRKNVVVGDVWLCGGQSNMEWAVNQAAGKEEAISASANPNIRLFTVKRRGLPEPQADLDSGDWAEAGPQSVAEFSAVGYYFGRDLEKALKVPIGLISTNKGGTTAERWMSLRAVDANPETKDMQAPQGKADLFNAMIAPLVPFAVKGAIWYQGESNVDRPYNYRHVLTAMVRNWRDTFGQGDFPFLVVELAPCRAPKDPDQWAVVRESQQWVANNSVNVETVSIVDVGDEKDIHPLQKQPVGARLAIAARARAYGEKITPAGPKYDNVTFNGNQAVIKFKNVGSGLVAKDGDLKGFTIAGEDKKFHDAQAKIEGDTVVVTSDAVPSPKAVRFGWENYPVVNLWNQDGLPAHPLRTDDWEVMKQNIK